MDIYVTAIMALNVTTSLATVHVGLDTLDTSECKILYL